MPGWPFLLGAIVLLAAVEAALIAAGLDPYLTIAATLVLAVALSTSYIVRSARLDSTRAPEPPYRWLLENSFDVPAVLTQQGEVRFIGPSVQRVFGHRPGRVEGTHLLDLVHDDDQQVVRDFLKSVAASASGVRVSYRLMHADGSWRHVESVGHAGTSMDAHDVLVVNTRDVTDWRALEDRVSHHTLHDPLTNLANRTLFRDRVDHAVARQARHHKGIAVVLLDLDGFKRINDAHGHGAGDSLLVEVAQRLQTCLRRLDTAARLGGDEFAVLLEDIRDHTNTAHVAERILKALRTPFNIAGREAVLDASIGIAIGYGRESADQLLRNADIAMYRAKEAGKGRYSVFESSMLHAVVHRLELETDLKLALERQEFRLHYQPLVDLRTGRITGAEALIRWEHPTRGRLMPGEFIGLAEETGLVVPLGRWVLDEACRQARVWQGRPNGPHKISLNLSPRQINSKDIVLDVGRAIRAAGVDPANITLEITETALLQDDNAIMARLEELKSVGVQLAIDDFGTGYSSLSYLRKFPIDVLKIDRSFVQSIDRDPDNAALVKAIVDLGTALRLDTVAEGIERHDQLLRFRELGCNRGQGFYFWGPLEPKGIDELLRLEEEVDFTSDHSSYRGPASGWNETVEGPSTRGGVDAAPGHAPPLSHTRVIERRTRHN